MYTPPQLDDDTSAQPHTYLFSPVGIGRRERREQWIWKEEIRESSRPQPFSYEYVIEDGKLPTITVRHPTNAANSTPVQTQRKLSKRTRPPGLDRHSSPASPGYSSPPASPRPTTTTTTKLKRALSLASIRVQRSSFEEEKKPLPALPRIESTILSDAMKPKFERTFFDASETDTEQPFQPSFAIPSWSPRRSSVTNPLNASPRIPRAPQIAPQSFEGKEDMMSPIALMKDSPKQVAPIRIPQVSSEAPRKLSLDTTRPTLQRQKSKFIEHLDSPGPSAEMPSQTMPSAALLTPTVLEMPASRNQQPRKVSFEQTKTGMRADRPTHARQRQLSLSTQTPHPSIPAAPTPRRAATVRTPTSGVSVRSVWSDAVCTAVISPIVASGPARLVSC